MMNSHDAAIALVARFLDIEHPTEEAIKAFYLEMTQKMTEEQRDLIHDWLLSADSGTTLKDLAQLVDRLPGKDDLDVDIEVRFGEPTPSYARGP